MEKRMKITVKALEKLKNLKPGGTSLRVSITAGGCSGLKYKMGFDAMNADSLNDVVYNIDDLEVRSDRKSHEILESVELDYEDGLNGKGFTFKNEAAKKCCGCGNSFSC